MTNSNDVNMRDTSVSSFIQDEVDRMEKECVQQQRKLDEKRQVLTKLANIKSSAIHVSYTTIPLHTLSHILSYVALNVCEYVEAYDTQKDLILTHSHLNDIAKVLFGYRKGDTNRTPILLFPSLIFDRTANIVPVPKGIISLELRYKRIRNLRNLCNTATLKSLALNFGSVNFEDIQRLTKGIEELRSLTVEKYDDVLKDFSRWLPSSIRTLSIATPANYEQALPIIVERLPTLRKLEISTKQPLSFRAPNSLLSLCLADSESFDLDVNNLKSLHVRNVHVTNNTLESIYNSKQLHCLDIESTRAGEWRFERMESVQVLSLQVQNEPKVILPPNLEELRISHAHWKTILQENAGKSLSSIFIRDIGQCDDDLIKKIAQYQPNLEHLTLQSLSGMYPPITTDVVSTIYISLPNIKSIQLRGFSWDDPMVTYGLVLQQGPQRISLVDCTHNKERDDLIGTMNSDLIFTSEYQEFYQPQDRSEDKKQEQHHENNREEKEERYHTPQRYEERKEAIPDTPTENSDRRRRKRELSPHTLETFSRIPCKHFMNGGCPHGDACYYKHPKVEEPRRSAYKRSQPTEVDYYGRNKSSSSRVFIGNIDMPTVDAHDIEQLFKPYGTISEIRVHMGYMFVQFDNAISAQNSLRANGAIMGRKPIAVQMASDKDIGGSSHMNSSLGKRSSQYDDDDMSPSLKRHKRSDVYGAPQPYDRREYRDPYYDDYYRYEQPLHQQQQSSYEYGYPRESRTPDQYRQSQQPASANNNRTRVFIKNLPRNTEWWGLKDFFKQCGLVKRADPFRDEHGACKGYGIVEFESEAAALHAINNLNGTLFNNRPISVSHVNEDIMPVAHGRALQ